MCYCMDLMAGLAVLVPGGEAVRCSSAWMRSTCFSNLMYGCAVSVLA